uniref:NADH dehydrogenase subunit 4L n=1 Tax=Glossiphonia complanata TaxID=60927 RepID=UPI002062671F|nr:NADH dehydrogenase subunit 4L [Glossiphonia complanata]UPP55804.1 NADH dehydrogenase subunit 4L [Glossiphonia complanata]UZT67715.1 NADH dehydrogenase subunit 4L [Glossiphonia complanata]
MEYLMMIVSITPIIAALNLILHKYHFLQVLLCLEVMTLSMLLFMSISYLSMNTSPSVISVVILSFGACEASLGLTLLALMVRSFGSDNMNNISMSKC